MVTMMMLMMLMMMVDHDGDDCEEESEEDWEFSHGQGPQWLKLRRRSQTLTTTDESSCTLNPGVLRNDTTAEAYSSVTQHAQVRYLQAAAGCSASSRFGFNGPPPFNACQITENTHRPEGLNP